MEVVPISRREDAGSIRWEMQNPSDISEELRRRGVKVLVHVAWDFTHPNAKENDRVNVEGSRQLFECADRAGVERIVFVSSISAFAGARSAYGQSKLRVERMVLERPGGVVIRPGLVWGAGPGGMFGALTKQVESGSMIPMIGSGRYPQYLVHEEDLGEAIRRAAAGSLAFDAPITVANEVPWQLRDIIKEIARKQRKQITLLPLPWPAVYAGLKTAEMLGAKLNFRSDSVLSLVFQDPSPDFRPANQLGIVRRGYPASQTGE
jgi:nucleoside-diphosphate-sugar epimerase